MNSAEVIFQKLVLNIRSITLQTFFELEASFVFSTKIALSCVENQSFTLIYQPRKHHV